ncbi:hypothetical protein Tco_1239311, partial [Tanacetum coccineum]
PLPPVISPTAESPGYVTESDPEEDPEEYEDDEKEDGPVDYPMDGGEDGDDDDGDSPGDDTDDEDEDEEDKDEEDEEEEEHLALSDSAVVVPTASISLPPEAEVARLIAMPTPPPSVLISLSPPSAGERLARRMAPSAHSSPPPVPSPLLPSSGCPTQIQTLRISSTQALVDAVTAALPSPPLPPLPPSLYIPPPVDRSDDVPESEAAELHEHDSHDLYALLEDAQDSRTRISQRVTMDSQRVDLLMEDWIAPQETILIVEEEAYASREAWAHSAYQTQLQLQGTLIQTQLQVHETRSQMQQTEMAELRETGHRRKARMSNLAPVTRRGPNNPPNNTNPNNMTPESIQAMIEQALLRNSTNGDGSHSSHGDNRRNVQTTRPCFYADFMKCQPLNFKGNEGVVGLTRWIEKMESVFHISGCAIENQVKFATCTLLGAALDWLDMVPIES